MLILSAYSTSYCPGIGDRTEPLSSSFLQPWRSGGCQWPVSVVSVSVVWEPKCTSDSPGELIKNRLLVPVPRISDSVYLLYLGWVLRICISILWESLIRKNCNENTGLEGIRKISKRWNRAVWAGEESERAFQPKGTACSRHKSMKDHGASENLK